LAEDHKRAADLAEAVNGMTGFSVDLDAVQSNMCYIEITDGRSTESVTSDLSERGIDLLSIGPTTIRAVTHLHITDEDIERTIAAFSLRSV
jgi:threonine aldolase